MKLGIMQPYFFPYIGYWQLINLVDKYVIYDDVNYIKGGWVNRNRILLDGEEKFINVYMLGASPYKLINEVIVDTDVTSRKTPALIKTAYRNAPFFEKAFPVIEKILFNEEKNLARFNGYCIKTICDYLGITTELVYSSEIDKNNQLKSQDKVIEICNILGATEYYNAIGGKDLYSENEFAKNGIKLVFVETQEKSFASIEGNIHKNMSIVDVMMNNSVEDIRNMLEEYTLE